MLVDDRHGRHRQDAVKGQRFATRVHDLVQFVGLAQQHRAGATRGIDAVMPHDSMSTCKYDNFFAVVTMKGRGDARPQGLLPYLEGMDLARMRSERLVLQAWKFNGRDGV
jgi:hypothetical protein